ncbi:MAG: tetratricopeptide repeat protein [Acidobacteria bacterium]|nr:tetratricopeptide repeat protein [Acidobacteriota bacterium]
MTIKSELKWILLIVLVCFSVFANSIGGEFVYDDDRQVARNPLIQDISLAGTALTSDVWAFKGDGNYTASNYWRPTFTAWQILNFQIFGLNPAGWHLTGILLHIAVCLLAFLLLRRWEMSQLTSFAIVLIFAVHPVHVESVAWISGSTDLLFAVFFLASVWFAENRRKGGGIADIGLSLAFFGLALGAKEIALFCVPVYYFIFLRDDSDLSGDFRGPYFSKKALMGSLLFGAVALVFFAGRWAVLGRITQPVENAVQFGDALRSVPSVFIFYLKQIVFPITLSVNYPLRPVTDLGISGFIVPAIASLVALAGLFYLARRSFLAALGLLLFLLPLLPVFNLTAFPADQMVHDRYLYLPLFGILIVVFASIERLVDPRFLLAAVVAISVALGVQTFLYNRVWANDLALWEHSVSVDPNSASGQAQYGVALSENGRNQEAINAFNAALDIEPSPYAYLGRAQTLIKNGQFEEAVWDLQTLTEMKSDKVNAYTLYQSYEALGVALQRKNDLVRAERVLREARKRLPIYQAALTEKIAVVLYLKNDKRSALTELESARNQARSELLPTSKSVFFRLGLLYTENGDSANARAAFQEFLKITGSITDREILAQRKQAAEILRTGN